MESLKKQFPAENLAMREEEDEVDLARGIGMLSLSGSGEPVYVGASSGVYWARVCAMSVHLFNLSSFGI